MRAIQGAPEHGDFVYIPADDWINDVSSPGYNWGFNVGQVETPFGAADMVRHFGLKDWATPERIAALQVAIAYWTARPDRRQRTDWIDELLTDHERTSDGDE
jgi:hypothetical protein